MSESLPRAGIERPRWSRTQRQLIAAILGLAFLVRIGAAFYWHDNAIALRDANANFASNNEPPAFLLGDSLSYWTLAENLSQGKPYQYGSPDAKVFRAPLYPLFLVPFTILGSVDDAVLAARFAGAGLSCISIWFVILLANQIAGFRSAALAGGLASLHPGSVGMSVIVLSEALFMPLMLAAIWYLCRAFTSAVPPDGISRDRATPWYRSDSLCFGVCSGLAVLARPSWLLFIPFLFVVACTLGPDRKHYFRIVMLALLGFGVVMSPWWIRNAMVTGRFVPTTLQVGLSLYDGLHEGATGASDEGMKFAFDLQDEQRRIDQGTPPEERLSTFEFRVDNLAKSKAVSWATQHPGEVAKLAIRKFLRTWSLWPDGGDVGSSAKRIVITLGSFGILALALVGTRIAALISIGGTDKLRAHEPDKAVEPRDAPLLANASRGAGTILGWQLLICWLPCLYFTLLHMVFVGSVRYREPAIVVLSVVAGIGLESVWQFLRKWLRRS
ncbi:MAG: ArnT family glycosyltransferase [Aureliella sp.]